MSDEERARRFTWLLDQTAMGCQAILHGEVNDIPFEIGMLRRHITEADEIAKQVSREALEKMEL